MCFLKPLKIKQIKGKVVTLENGIKAHYDKQVGELNIGNLVLVYGNVVLQKLK